MRHGEITPIDGAWSEQEHAWLSEPVLLGGDCWLEVTLPDKGRMIIKKSETSSGVYARALISPWTGPDFRIRIYGSTKYRYIIICLTDTPDSIGIASTRNR